MRLTIIKKHFLACIWITGSWYSCSEPQASPQKQKKVAVASSTSLATTSNESLSKADLMGKITPQTDPRFVIVDPIYASKPDMYLRKEAYQAFKKMAEAASKAGISLKIVSATRNFNYQKGIWEAKWHKLEQIKAPEVRVTKILEYSAMPGASRHHWGTDIDLNALENVYFEGGQGKLIYTWLTQHAATFGFCQPYSAGRATGYKEEKWHWSYLPLSKPMTESAKTQLRDIDISGFQGAETAVHLKIIDNFVLGIHQDCLK